MKKRMFKNVAILFLVFLPFSSHAQWNQDTGLILLDNLTDHQQWWVVPDDQGGFWLSYMLNYTERRCYLQHYDSLGYSYYEGSWGLTMVDPEVFEDFVFLEGMVSDGDGGVILSFLDLHSEGDHPFGLYAQRFDRNGNRMWGDEALPVAIGRYAESGLEPSVVMDDSGGAYLGYWAYVEGVPVAVQHVTHDGEVLFEIDSPHGAPCSYGGVFPRRHGDGVLTWGYSVPDYSYFSCSEFNAEGGVEWTRLVGNPAGSITPRDEGSAVETANDGVWVAYGTGTQPHITRLSPNGFIVIPAMNMFPDYTQTNPYYSLVICDDDGNAYLRVSPTGTNNYLRINKVTPDGSLPWGGEGLLISREDRPTDILGRSTELLWDGDRQSVIVGFERAIILNDTTWWNSIFIQSLFPDGSREWGDEGSLVMKTDMALLLARGFVIKLSDGSYAVIVTGGLNERRYLIAGKVYSDGTAVGTSGITEQKTSLNTNDWRILSTYPNPFNCQVVFDLQMGVGECQLCIFNLYGQQVLDYIIPQNRSRYTWEPDAELSSGVYFAVLKAGNKKDIKKLILLR